MLGVAEFMSLGWCTSIGTEPGTMPSIPNFWAIKLTGDCWHCAQVALLNIATLTMEVLPGAVPDVVGSVGGEIIAVVTDRTAASVSDRQLHWEITPVDPRSENVLTQIERADRCCLSKTTKTVSGELSQAFARRKTDYSQEDVAGESESFAAVRTPPPCISTEPSEISVGKVASIVETISSCQRVACGVRDSTKTTFGSSHFGRSSSAGHTHGNSNRAPASSADMEPSKMDIASTVINEAPPVGGVAAKLKAFRDISAASVDGRAFPPGGALEKGTTRSSAIIAGDQLSPGIGSENPSIVSGGATELPRHGLVAATRDSFLRVAQGCVAGEPIVTESASAVAAFDDAPRAGVVAERLKAFGSLSRSRAATDPIHKDRNDQVFRVLRKQRVHGVM